MSCTLWFTGLSGAGKTTLSRAVLLSIRQRGVKAEWLDGDIIRANFSAELGFTKRDRDVNVRRIGFVSHLLNRNGVVSVVAAIAPYEDARKQNRALLDRYVEVFCKCPLDVLCERDPKGLYRRAIAGEIKCFTGVSDPYEEPCSPDIVLDTASKDIESCSAEVVAYLEQCGLIPCEAGCLSAEAIACEEVSWRKRLASLGYAR